MSKKAEWQVGYLPTDGEAQRLYARALFWEMYAEMHNDLFESLRPIAYSIPWVYVTECQAEGIWFFEIDPVAISELFRWSGEPTERRSVTLKHSHRAMDAARAEARETVKDWCDTRNLKADWCYEHIASVLQRFWQEQASQFRVFLKGEDVRFAEQMKRDASVGRIGEFFQEMAGARFVEWFNPRWALASLFWGQAVRRLQQAADKQAAAPTPARSVEELTQYVDEVMQGKQPSFPELEEPFRQGGQAGIAAERRKHQAQREELIQEALRIEGQRDLVIEEEENKEVPAAELFQGWERLEEQRQENWDAVEKHSEWLPQITPQDITRLTTTGRIKSRKAFLDEVKSDLERCFNEAFDQIPKRYLPPVHVRKTFVGKAKERCEKALSKYNTVVDAYAGMHGYQTGSRQDFERNCKRLIRRLLGIADNDSADFEREEYGASEQDDQPIRPGEVETVRKGAKSFAEFIGLPLKSRKTGPAKKVSNFDQ